MQQPDSTTYRSKRKRSELAAHEYDAEHRTKRFKSLCDGLLQYDSDTLHCMQRHHYLCEGLDYGSLSLDRLTLQRNDTYFFCNGQGNKEIGSSLCSTCVKMSQNIQKYYIFFDQRIVKEVCGFIDKAKTKKWISFTTEQAKTDDGEIQFIVAINKNGRSVRWVINDSCVTRYVDNREGIRSRDSSIINKKYLLNQLKKWLPSNLQYCGGLGDNYNWFTKDVYTNYKTAHWIDDHNVVHVQCAVKGSKLCKKCKQLNCEL
eukprot:35352_1